MKIIVCLDDDNGMLFNNRRQSRDICAIEKINDIVGDDTLFISEFSSKLFQNYPAQINNNMLSDAKADDYCFVEDKDIGEYPDRIEQIFIFRWNRRYPSDFKFDICFLQGYEQVHTEDFNGHSHDKITLEVWQKINIREGKI